MRDPSARLLRLLSFLQTPREWSGTELAERLGVTTRTIRRDVERLRELGYPIHATHGNTGGYRLTAGAAMPPLLLDDEEAIAITIGLRTAATTAVTGIENASLRALAKLEQVLPARLRRRVAALSDAAVTAPPAEGPTADPATLAALASAVTAHERIRFAYTRADGDSARRLAEPHQMVALGRRWYLVAFDEDRAAWRTFRVDRMAGLHRTGVRVPPRELLGGVDAATWVARSLERSSGGTVRARVLLHAPIGEAAPCVPAWQGTLEPVDAASCRLTTPPDSPGRLAHRLLLLPVPCTLLDPPEVAAELAALGDRAAVMAGGGGERESNPPSRDTRDLRF